MGQPGTRRFSSELAVGIPDGGGMTARLEEGHLAGRPGDNRAHRRVSEGVTGIRLKVRVSPRHRVESDPDGERGEPESSEVPTGTAG